MSGLGLMNRRRAIQSSPIKHEKLSAESYIQDAALLLLDGIEKGNTEGQWTSLVNGNHSFVNYGAIAEDDGWRFDGNSSYMSNATLPSYSWNSGGYRTLEVVAEFERDNTTEIVLMGKQYGICFGRYTTGECIVLSDTTILVPSIADDMKAGIRAMGIVMDDITSASIRFSNGVQNGTPIKDSEIKDKNGFGSPSGAVLLGKRITGNAFKGKIYAIRLHNRALTNEELLQNYEIDKIRFGL